MHHLAVRRYVGKRRKVAKQGYAGLARLDQHPIAVDAHTDAKEAVGETGIGPPSERHDEENNSGELGLICPMPV
jgi:hypothetical protein